jgi:hypothetical protein
MTNSKKIWSLGLEVLEEKNNLLKRMQKHCMTIRNGVGKSKRNGYRNKRNGLGKRNRRKTRKSIIVVETQEG